MSTVFQWLRSKFLTGLFVTVPVVVSVVACVWLFGVVDGFVNPFWHRWIGMHIPGLGLVSTAALVLLAGVLASNVLGKRLLRQADTWLERVPVFRTVYSPVKQIVEAFSPDSESGFKRVVLVDDPRRGWVIGFLTREFTIRREDRVEWLVAVFVPTNHLYLGDVVIVPREAVQYPDLSVEDGVRIVLTGGMGLPAEVRTRSGDEAGQKPLG
jgi:uncharacterized membrane protein